MKKIVTAIALTIAIPAAAYAQTAAPARTQQQSGQMNHGNMAHPKMDHSKMGQMKMGEGDCCKKSADGKMECQMMKGHGQQGAGANSQGHSNH